MTIKRGNRVRVVGTRSYNGRVGPVATINRCSGTFVKHGDAPPTGERCADPAGHTEYGVDFGSSDNVWFTAAELIVC